jgi:hypothetical protein
MEDVVHFMTFSLFYDHLVYFVAIWYILWPFGILFPFWYVVLRQIWQPCSTHEKLFFFPTATFFGILFVHAYVPTYVD